jgi:hypothetical protein
VHSCATLTVESLTVEFVLDAHAATSHIVAAISMIFLIMALISLSGSGMLTERALNPVGDGRVNLQYRPLRLSLDG